MLNNVTTHTSHKLEGLDGKTGTIKKSDMKVLMILTSHDKLGDTGEKTGFWLEEFAAPYYVLLDAGAKITLASPAGGKPPLDPKSDVPDAQTEATKRFKKDEAVQSALANTAKLADIDADVFDAIFYPGGHGPLWDLAENPDSRRLIETFIAKDRPVAAVCHAPAVFLHTKGTDGKSLVSGRRVTSFTNTEEEAAGLTKIVPFLVENMLKTNGGLYEKGADWSSYVVVDGKLVTGQNPASSEAAAQELLKLINHERTLMLIKLSTNKTVNETATALQAAVEANHFGVMQVHNLKETMTKKGVEFAHECLIYEVCQPQQAKKVLDENMSVSTALPCRISVYEEGGKTILATLKPTTLLALFNTPQLKGVAQEVEDTIMKIMKEAAAG